MPTPAFAFEDVSVVVADGSRILDRVDATVPSDGITVIAGPSGSGKSTLLRLCNRLEVPTSGRVRFAGDDIAGLDPLAHRRRVGMVFQRPTLFAGTVRDNLRVAATDASDARFGDVLDLVGLGRGFLDRTGDDLSGGEAQRACIARALLTGPEVLLMDEATSALDPDARHTIEELGRQLATDGLTLLWVTHDLDQVARVADRCLVILEGRVAEASESAEFLAGRAPSGERGGSGDARDTGDTGERGEP
jgi:putative ABC transport system ATP-binding protein